jgi:hypothetical protein
MSPADDFEALQGRRFRRPAPYSSAAFVKADRLPRSYERHRPLGGPAKGTTSRRDAQQRPAVLDEANRVDRPHLHL